MIRNDKRSFMKKIRVHCLDGYYYVEDGYLCYSCPDLQDDVEVTDLSDLTIAQYNELACQLLRFYPDFKILQLQGRFI
jgi:hypothetical protein